MKYGFLDEAGDVAYAAGATATFIKAVVKARKAWRQILQNAPELKAAHNIPRITETLLRHAVEIGFDAVAVVVDKGKISQPENPEELYRLACGRAVREALVR